MVAAFAIRLLGVSKSFPGAGAPAVDDLTLDIPTGEIVALVGPSGCGKTTTLKMINRLIDPTGGTIEILGQPQTALPVHELRRQIGYVIQRIGLFPHRTISANMATVPRLLGWDRAATAARVRELVGLVGLDDELLDRYPHELSGGQQQRVGVARALAADPPIMLMDEPYSAVDPIVRGRLQDELLGLQSTLHKTIVLVTHDVEEAITLGDRVALLDFGGRIAQFGAPDDLLREPASPFVESFLGRERGLRRLGLLKVRDIGADGGPVVDRSAPVRDARQAMKAYGTSWVGVLDGRRMLGWLAADELTGDVVAGCPVRPFVAQVTPDTPLREALDGMVLSTTSVAVVTGDDGYEGMLWLHTLGDGLRG